MLPESLLQFIWKFRLFGGNQLQLAGRESLEIIFAGHHNRDSGPDFLDARLKIDGTLWAGNVEVHRKASDWYRHTHHTDASYSNVILHVVYEDDQRILDASGNELPVLVLAPLIDSDMYERWKVLEMHHQPIACGIWEKPTEPFYSAWLNRLLAERLEEKSGTITEVLQFTANNWDEAFYLVLARSFGFKVNAEPFEQLARSIPLKIVQKHKQSTFQLEALFLGQSGLIDQNVDDEYPRKLYEEYVFLKHQYGLRSMQPHVWKHLRMRPVNFPAIRIVQFAHLMASAPDLKQMISEVFDLLAFHKSLEVNPKGYWLTHYQIDAQSPHSSKGLGRDARLSVMINSVIPFLFIYARFRGNQELRQRVLNWLEILPPEKHAIARLWELNGVRARHAGDSQALIRLLKAYCEPGKCLDCSWGLRYLKEVPSLRLAELPDTVD